MFGLKTGGFETTREAQAYFEGVAAGLWQFAWWRDGTQYVGTTGTTLAQALAEAEAHARDVIAALAIAQAEAEPAAEPSRKGRAR